MEVLWIFISAIVLSSIGLLIGVVKIEFKYLKNLNKIEADDAKFYRSIVKEISKEYPGLVSEAFKKVEEE
ncbi:MAG: hypothetical protein RR533_04525 [Carnobacterium sp.]